MTIDDLANITAQEVVPKLWGKEFWVVANEEYCMKFLRVDPGYQCSIHAHAEKDETFVVYSGILRLNIHYGNGEWRESLDLCPGERYRIHPETFHSFRSGNDEVAWIMEVSTCHSDDDVTRLQSSRKLASE